MTAPTERDTAFLRVLTLAREWRMFDRVGNKRADDLLQQLAAALDALYPPTTCQAPKNPDEIGGERCGAEAVHTGPGGGLCAACLELVRKNYPHSLLAEIRRRHGLFNNPFE